MAAPFVIFAESSPENVLHEDKTEFVTITNEPLPELSIVHSDGSVIETAHGVVYEIQESDWNQSGGWILPASLTIKDLKDGSDYPLEITNNTTKTTVRGRLVAPKDVDNPKDLEPTAKPSEK